MFLVPPKPGECVLPNPWVAYLSDHECLSSGLDKLPQKVATVSSKPCNVHRERDPRKCIRGVKSQTWCSALACIPKIHQKDPKQNLTTQIIEIA